MMAYVKELVVLVGKSSNGTKKGPAAEVKMPKKAIHKIMTVAAPVERAKNKPIEVHREKGTKPEQIIPMDDDDFKDF